MMYRFEDEKYCVWKLPQDELLAPGTHSHFESGKFSQFWPEPGTNPAQWVRLKTPFRVHPKQPN